MSARILRDSRLVQPGDVFVAMADDPEQRRAHIAQARERGAGRVVGYPGDAVDEAVPEPRWWFAREHARTTPWRADLPLAGVTGTDGKSTVVHLIHHCLGAGGARIGTLGWHDGQHLRPSEHTTPPPEQLHTFLAALPASCPGVAVECSSHGLHQGRVAALRFQAVVWTGLSHDHLDYHGDVAAYAASKMLLIKQLLPDGLCVVRDEDPRAHVVAHAAQGMGGRVVRLGFSQLSEVRLERAGGRWHMRSAYCDLELPVVLPGSHNAWNAAAAVLAAQALGQPLERAIAALQTAPVVPGRLQRVRPDHAVYVDYAHTEGALETVLRALRSEHPGKRLICVFGCGGDRDPDKRRPMGQVAFRLADYIVVTNDNPRGEDPRAIADAITAGLPVTETFDGWRGLKRVLIQLDRGAAIRAALRQAGRQGVVLIAGKGHEQEQVTGREHRVWDDVAQARRAIEEVFG